MHHERHGVSLRGEGLRERNAVPGRRVRGRAHHHQRGAGAAGQEGRRAVRVRRQPRHLRALLPVLRERGKRNIRCEENNA